MKKWRKFKIHQVFKKLKGFKNSLRMVIFSEHYLIKNNHPHIASILSTIELSHGSRVEKISFWGIILTDESGMEICCTTQ